ncbi:MAG: Methyltransferase type 11 [Phycisphaerales bacterium]|nr:Methyltransferase type 11 [Phycisphaerales bacterium]
MSNSWDANHYDAAHSYVWTLAADLIELLAPQRGERVLDLGCGTGHLTAKIAERGAVVVGIDASAEMVRQAQENYPGLSFRVGDATSFEVDEPVDAVFSNATLHWVKDARGAAGRIVRALRPGGRLVAEFGGKGNVREVCRAIAAGLEAVGAPSFESLSPWYFPSIVEYAAVLEGAGLEVTFATLFDRPTLVEAGLRSWVEMYGTTFLAAVGEQKREAFLDAVEEAARGALFKEGKWVADYRRLRVAARRVG